MAGNTHPRAENLHAGRVDSTPAIERNASRHRTRASLTVSLLIATSLALVTSLPTSCSGGGSSTTDFVDTQDPPLTFNPGDTVASFELAAPADTTFILHATLPIPPHVFPRSDNTSPFQLYNRNAGTFPAQTETVSRYPADTSGADVVEILAPVIRPSNTNPGDRITFSVIFQPHTQPALTPDPDVTALLSTPASLRLRTRDVFHNTYSSDLWSDVATPTGNLVRTLRQGSTADQRVTHTTLLPSPPVSGPTGTLAHMMSVHAYLTQWKDEPFFSLDLRVHNGASGLDDTDPTDDPLGKIYFEALELALPQGWTLLNAFDDPFFRAPYDEGATRVWPIVGALLDGTLHMMLPMAQFERRLCIVKTGFEARALSLLHEEGLAFCRPGVNVNDMPLFSWWNSQTARYFPQRQRLPLLTGANEDNLRAADEGQLDMRLSQVATGSAGLWPAPAAGLGWAHPWSVSDGGMVSGEEIYLIDGVTTACAASSAGYRLHQLTHRMYTDRQHNVLYDKNGLPTSMPEWLITTPQGTFLPVWWYNSAMLWASDPFGFSSAPTFQVNAVTASGLAPAYEATLAQYDPIDEAHMVRYTHTPKVLVWLGNDALAKDDLRMQAEGFRFAYSKYPQDLYGGVIPTGLLSARTFVDEFPNRGVFYGRGEAWGLDVVNAAYSTQDPAFRAGVKAWFGDVIDVVEDGQAACSGIIQSTPLGNVFGGQYACRQSIEAAITENALVGMRESVFNGDSTARVDQVNGVLRRSFYAMISPLVWSAADHGPWAMIATAPHNIALPPFCDHVPADGNYGYADHYQIWSSFAYAWKITHDAAFLNKAMEALGVADLSAMNNAPLDNIQNKAALLALVQTL